MLCLGDLVVGDVADSEVADQSLLPQLGKGAERFGDRTRLRAVGVAHTDVDQVEYLDVTV
jgi:hypothetical protein